MPSRRELVCAAALVGFSVRGMAAEAATRIPGWGTLTFPLPDNWRVQRSADSPPSLTLGPDRGQRFEVKILPFTSPQPGIPPSTPESLSGQANANAKYRARDAEEAVISVLQFRTADAFGYYYSFTDKAPKPREFRYFTEGLAQIAGYPILFVVSSEHASPELVTTVLKVLQQGRRA